MKVNFNKKYFILTLILLVIEILIGVFVHDNFIRPFIGDVLVVILLFTFFRIFYKGSSLKLILAVLAFSFTIEILQYFNLVSMLGLQDNKLAKIVLGATFDFLDLLAYLIGCVLNIFIDRRMFKTKPQ